MTGQFNDNEGYIQRSSNDYWYRQAVVDRVHELYRSGNVEALHLPRAIANGETPLVKAAIILFGGWYNTILEAGIEPKAIDKLTHLTRDFWSPGAVVKQIGILYGSRMDLGAGFIRHVYPELYYSAIAKQFFGSWPKSLSAAEVDYKSLNSSSNRFWTVARIKKALVDHHQAYGNIQPVFIKSQNPSLYTGFRRYFKTWSEAVSAAQLNLEQNRLKVFIEKFRTFVLKEYLKNVLDLQKVEYDVHVIQTRSDHIEENCNEYYPGYELPDHYLENTNAKSRVYTTAQYRSWGPEIKHEINDALTKYARVLIYHSIGEPRQWLTENVKFININEFYMELTQIGRDDIVSDLSLLARGGVPKSYQGHFEGLMEPIRKMRKKKH